MMEYESLGSALSGSKVQGPTDTLFKGVVEGLSSYGLSCLRSKESILALMKASFGRTLRGRFEGAIGIPPQFKKFLGTGMIF